MKFSKEKFVNKLGTIEVNGQSIDTLIRIFPGFSPNGLGFTISLDLEDEKGNLKNNNYIYIFALYFKIDGNSIIPIIHTIQNSIHNIGFHKGEIVHIDEGLANPNGVKLLEKEDGDSQELLKEKKKLKLQITKSFSKLLGGVEPETELIALLCDKIFAYGIKDIKIANGNQNLWLNRHNTDREKNSIGKSGKNMYQKKAESLGAKEDGNGNYNVSISGVTKYLGKYPNFIDIYKNLLKNLTGLISNIGGIVNKLEEKKDLNEDILHLKKIFNENLKSILDIQTRQNNIENFSEIYNSSVIKKVPQLASKNLKEDKTSRNIFLEGSSSLRDKRGKHHIELLQDKIESKIHDLLGIINLLEQSAKINKTSKQTLEEISKKIKNNLLHKF